MRLDMSRAKGAVALVLLGLLVAACGRPAPTARAEGSVPISRAGESGSYEDLDSPPPVTVRYFDESIDLLAWTYCYGSVCADGAPPEEPADVGSPEEVVVEFPIEGWSFTAFFRPSGDACGREQQTPLEATGAGRFVLRPIGYADTYDVTLFGQGGGDLFVTFRWATPTDGPLPAPSARLAVLADHDGRVDSYGVELALENLAATPRDASAKVTVRADDGEEVMFEATRTKLDCLPEGSAYWDGPDAEGLAAAALGGDSFVYEVELVIDDIRYVATADWPADEIVGNEPSVALDFTPDLPALT